VDPQRVRRQLERILSSSEFSGADRAKTFLRLVVERALEGGGEQIKETVIAIEAFNREVDFDPKTDPIVRVEAGRLRDRLKAYYEREGQTDGVLIELPKGRYVPHFADRRVERRLDLVKLSIVLPADTPVDSFAISPDGRIVAFTATVQGVQRLWVRRLDHLESRPLPGTDGARYPFWSPDSRTIGYFAQTKLRRVDAAGGPPRDLADVIVGRGGAWSRTGVIVYSPRPLGVLHAIPENGGTPQPVTSLDEARGEAGHGFPHFLPDGRHFIYLAMSARAEQSAIRLASLDSSSSKVLLRADASALYARALPELRSAVVYVSDGTLLAQRLDLERQTVEGEPLELADNVAYRRWYQTRASIADSGVFLYQSGNPDQYRFSWISRDGALVEPIGPRNDAVSFSLSPDDRHVAFYRDNDPATVYPKVWTMDLNRTGAVSRVTDTEAAGADFCPIWSPDGTEILFSRGDDRGMRLMRQPVGAGPASCVLDTPGPKFPSDWSHDGRTVAYTSQVPDFRWLHVWIADLDTGVGDRARPFLQHSFSEANAYFAPPIDGDERRFISYASGETGRDEIYVCDFPSGKRKWQVSTHGGLMPHWRHDGRELFYLALDGVLNVTSVRLGTTVEIDVPHPLFATGIQFVPQHKAWMNQYAVARGGERFLVNRPVSPRNRDEITVVLPPS
jgi:eukaryotic-like serine/threonine-protein kinase